KWPVLAVLSLGGTVLYQAFWIGLRMGPERLLVGLGVLGVFGVVFALAGRSTGDDARREWLVTQAGGLLLPFAFAVYIAGSARLGPHLYPVALLLLLLSAAACWVGREQKRPWIVAGAASGSGAVVGVWLLTRDLGSSLAWEASVCAVLVALVFHLFADWHRRRYALEETTAAIASAGGLFFFLVCGSLLADGVAPWPWLAGWLALGTLLARQASFAGREILLPIAAGAVGAGVSLAHLVHGREASFPPVAVYLAVMLGIAAAAQIGALAHGPRLRRSAEHGAALLATILVLSMSAVPERLWVDPSVFLGGALGLGLLAVFAATRLRSGPWVFAAVAATLLAHASWTAGEPRLRDDPSALLAGLGMQGLAVAVFTAWPFVTGESLRRERWAWYTAALAAPGWFLPLKHLFELRYGDAFIGVLPLLLAAVSLGALARVRTLWPES
ncbi:MAG: hypothetical protein ACREQY_05430, partial [Candidatus Binatia bacterium]